MTQQPRYEGKRTSTGWLAGFGRRLLRARTRAGLTQQALGAPDLSKSFVSLLEAGRSHPSVETAIALASRVKGSVGMLLLEPEDLRMETAFNLLHIAAQVEPGASAAEATRLVETAELLLPQTPGEIQALSHLARARIALAAGDLQEAERRAGEAASVARHHEAGGLLGVALAAGGEALLQRQDYTAAVCVLEEATATLQRAKAIRTEEGVEALVLLGRAAHSVGRLDAARKAYRRAVELSARLRAPVLRAQALAEQASVETAAGRTTVAGSLLEQAADALKGAGETNEARSVGRQIERVRGELSLGSGASPLARGEDAPRPEEDPA